MRSIIYILQSQSSNTTINYRYIGIPTSWLCKYRPHTRVNRQLLRAYIIHSSQYIYILYMPLAIHHLHLFNNNSITTRNNMIVNRYTNLMLILLYFSFKYTILCSRKFYYPPQQFYYIANSSIREVTVHIFNNTLMLH